MFQLIPNTARGTTQLPWLTSLHSFSFGSYYNPKAMGFSALRVINDDWVAPGQGFATHAHRDMEILSVVLQGKLEHRDSQGNSGTLGPGDFQLMSAGSGIEHSEYNPCHEEPLHFLQIWIRPSQRSLKPNYQQTRLANDDGLHPIATSASGMGMQLNQDASVYLLRNSSVPPEPIHLPIAKQRCTYIHMLSGEAHLDLSEETEIGICRENSAPLNSNADHQRVTLSAGDGIFITGASTHVTPAGQPEFEALIFDVPKQV